jgi:hypothetical protein
MMINNTILCAPLGKVLNQTYLAPKPHIDIDFSR